MTKTTVSTTNTNPTAQEPVAIGGAVLGLGNAVLAALPLFGVPVTVEQIGALNAVMVALVALVTVLVRRYSVAKANVGERVDPKTGAVTAGPANDLVIEGEVIRNVNDTEPDAEV